jgi:hypothetical protein
MRRAAGWRFPAESLARAVYGVITIGALLAAESGTHESYTQTLGSALIAAGIFWLAHAYTSLLGRRLATRGRLTAGELSDALIRESAILAGASIPILVLLCGWAAGAAQETAATAALWSAVAGVIALEIVAGIRSHATRGELALEAGVGITMGMAILALKVVLH